MVLWPAPGPLNCFFSPYLRLIDASFALTVRASHAYTEHALSLIEDSRKDRHLRVLGRSHLGALTSVAI